MDLFCPHCTRRVTIPDDKAGQATACPLCAQQFMTPALAPPPVVPKPSAPPTPPPVSAPPQQETYGMGPAPVPPPLPKPPVMPSTAPAPGKLEPSPPPPPPPGEYSRSFSLSLTGDWLAFVPTACLAAILVLSAFNWHYESAARASSLWGLSFSSETGKGQFLIYSILMFPTYLLVVVAMLFDRGLLFTPPQLAPAMLWKNLAIGLVLGLSFLCLSYDYLNEHFLVVDRANSIALAMKLAFRLHFIAMAASFLMFWLHLRKSQNLPPPICDVKW